MRKEIANTMMALSCLKQEKRLSLIERVCSMCLLATITVVVPGCAAETVVRAAETRPARNLSASELAFQSRDQALMLSRLADSLEVEAQWYTQQHPDSPAVAEKLAHIQDLRMQAEAAFERASEHRSRVPHNQVY